MISSLLSPILTLLWLLALLAFAPVPALAPARSCSCSCSCSHSSRAVAPAFAPALAPNPTWSAMISGACPTSAFIMRGVLNERGKGLQRFRNGSMVRTRSSQKSYSTPSQRSVPRSPRWRAVAHPSWQAATLLPPPLQYRKSGSPGKAWHLAARKALTFQSPRHHACSRAQGYWWIPKDFRKPWAKDLLCFGC